MVKLVGKQLPPAANDRPWVGTHVLQDLSGHMLPRGHLHPPKDEHQAHSHHLQNIISLGTCPCSSCHGALSWLFTCLCWLTALAMTSKRAFGWHSSPFPNSWALSLCTSSLPFCRNCRTYLQVILLTPSIIGVIITPNLCMNITASSKLINRYARMKQRQEELVNDESERAATDNTDEL